MPNKFSADILVLNNKDITVTGNSLYVGGVLNVGSIPPGLISSGDSDLKYSTITNLNLTGSNSLNRDITISGLVNNLNISGFITGVSFGRLLRVDNVYGNNTTAQKERYNKPFLTPVAAVSASSSGDCILLGPGIFDIGTDQLVLPHYVSLIGQGMDITTIVGSRVTPNGSIIKPGTNSLVANLTIAGNAQTGQFQYPLGRDGENGEVAFTGAVFQNIKTLSDSDGIYVNAPEGDTPSRYTTFEAYNCIFDSKFDCINLIGSVSGNFHNCQSIAVGPSFTEPVGGFVRALNLSNNSSINYYGGRIFAKNGSIHTYGVLINSSASILNLSNTSVITSSTAGGTILDINNNIDCVNVKVNNTLYNTSKINGYLNDNTPNLSGYINRAVTGISISGGLGIRNAFNINAGSNITLTQVGSNTLSISSAAGGGASYEGVTGLSITGGISISGAISISAGDNITLNQAGNNVTINSTAEGGSNIQNAITGLGTANFYPIFTQNESGLRNGNIIDSGHKLQFGVTNSGLYSGVFSINDAAVGNITFNPLPTLWETRFLNNRRFSYYFNGAEQMSLTDISLNLKSANGAAGAFQIFTSTQTGAYIIFASAVTAGSTLILRTASLADQLNPALKIESTGSNPALSIVKGDNSNYADFFAKNITGAGTISSNGRTVLTGIEAGNNITIQDNNNGSFTINSTAVGGATILTPITGAGTNNFVPKFTLDNSGIYNSNIISNNKFVGINAAAPRQSLEVSGEILSYTSNSINFIVATGSNSTYQQINLINKSNSQTASTDLVATNDIGTETNYYVDLGINSSTYSGGYIGYSGDSYLYSQANDFYIGNPVINKKIIFFAGNAPTGIGNSLMVMEPSQVRVSGNIFASGGRVLTTEYLCKSITIENPTSSENWNIFRTDKAISITKVTTVITGTSTPAITWNIRHSTDRNSAGTSLLSTPLATTNQTTGHTITNFANPNISGGSFIRFITVAQSGTVNEVHSTICYQ